MRVENGTRWLWSLTTKQAAPVAGPQMLGAKSHRAACKSNRSSTLIFSLVPYLSPQNPKKEPAKDYVVFRRSLSMQFPKYKEDLKVALVTRAQHLGSCGYDARNSANGPANRGGLARNLLCGCRDATRAPTPTQTLTYNFCG